MQIFLSAAGIFFVKNMLVRAACTYFFLLLFSLPPLQAYCQSADARLRGAMVASRPTAQDLRDLAALGANHIRWQLTWGGFPKSPADTASPEAYRQWLRENIWYVKSMLPLCDSLGLRVLIDLHTLPGGQAFEAEKYLGHRMFRDPAQAAAFRLAWEDIPLAFRHEKAIWGYDLANEPETVPIDPDLWRRMYPRIAEQVRALDPHKVIVIEGNPFGGIKGLTRLRPVPQLGPVVYSFHMYEPIAFTHQGVHGALEGFPYPGTISGKLWDSAALRQAMQPVRDWQLLHNARIYVGEFSAIRWAPDSSAYRYLRDCITLFEEWGWSWAYHAWREWDGWSVEYGSNQSDAQPATEPTDRLLLLKDVFRKNKPVLE